MFEVIIEKMYSWVLTEDRDSYSKNTQLGVTFFSGFLAGIICAIGSHPMDTMVSKVYAADTTGKGLR